MATEAAVKTAPASKQSPDFEDKVKKLRELYADASEISKTALENVIRALQVGRSRNGIGRRRRKAPAGSAPVIGKVSELTAIIAAQERRSQAHAGVF